jgi:anaerobic selenocysteine-containing dehydrogenase
MDSSKEPKGKIEPYHHPAAGWGALKYVAINLIKERVNGGNYRMLFRQNQPDGFDCPGCAWPDRQHASTFEFCENGVKAVAAEATTKRVTPAFFAAHTVEDLMKQTDYELEQHGRLTDPMVYDAQTDRYQPIAWKDAFALIARHLNQLESPNQAAFYTSGRASNEAAFLYQLFVRMFGTNNFPDCSNMCHEATSRGLPTVVGIGKGTISRPPTPSSSSARTPRPTTRVCSASCARPRAAAPPSFRSTRCASAGSNASPARSIRSRC